MTPAAATPRRPTGRRRGDSGTRDAIADAARTLFAVHGYDTVSVRAIAAEAGVDHALVHHFFGTKAQLFERLMALPIDAPDTIRRMLEPGLDGLGERVARHVIGQLRSSGTGGTMVALVRAAASDPRAAEILRARYTRDLLDPVAVALEVDRPALRAALCCSQLLGLALTEQLLGLSPLVDADTESLVTVYGATLQRYLVAPLGL